MSEIFGKDALFSFVNEHYGIEPDYPFSDDASAVLITAMEIHSIRM